MAPEILKRQYRKGTGSGTVHGRASKHTSHLLLYYTTTDHISALKTSSTFPPMLKIVPMSHVDSPLIYEQTKHQIPFLASEVFQTVS